MRAMAPVRLRGAMGSANFHVKVVRGWRMMRGP